MRPGNRGDRTPDYQSALDLFNQTIANLTFYVDAERANAIADLNNMYANSSDPVDAGAYNLTLYGMNQVGAIHTHVIDTVGNVSNYFIDNNSTMVLQTEQTGVSGSLVSDVTGPFSGLFTAITDPNSLLPSPEWALLIPVAVFSLVLVMFLIKGRMG